MKLYRQVKNFTNKTTLIDGLVYFEPIGNTTSKMYSRATGLCLGWVDNCVYLGGINERLFNEEMEI